MFFILDSRISFNKIFPYNLDGGYKVILDIIIPAKFYGLVSDNMHRLCYITMR